MNKIVLTTIGTLLVSAFTFGQDSHIDFVDIELDSAYKLAKAEDKLLFVDCYTTWCGPCKWMDKNIFTNDTVADYFNDNFVSIKLDMEKGDGKVFAGWYEVRSYPTYIFLDLSKRRRELVHRTVGSMDAQRFVQFAMDASNPEARIGESIKKYAEGNRDPEFIKNYIGQLYEAGYSKDAKEIAYWHYQEIDWTKIDSADAKALLRFINGSGHPYYDDMMKNLSSLEKVADSDQLYSSISRGMSTLVYAGLRKDNPAVNFNNAMKQIDEMSYSRKDELRSQLELYYYGETDTDKYLEIAPEIMEKYYFDNFNFLNSVAWKIYETTDSKKHLKSALALINRSVEIEEGYANMDTKMRILYVLGKNKEALALGKEITTLIDETPVLDSRKETHAAAVAAMKAGKDIKGMD